MFILYRPAIHISNVLQTLTKFDRVRVSAFFSVCGKFMLQWELDTSTQNIPFIYVQDYSVICDHAARIEMYLCENQRNIPIKRTFFPIFS